jgi:hypothetical protein
MKCLSGVTCRDVTIHFFHKRYVSRYLICIQLGLDALNLQSQRLKASITIIMPLMRLPISLGLDLWNIFCPVSPAWYRADNVFVSLISPRLRQHVIDTYWLYFYNRLVCSESKMKCLSGVTCRDVTIHFFHKRYVSRYLICITIHFIGN